METKYIQRGERIIKVENWAEPIIEAPVDENDVLIANPIGEESLPVEPVAEAEPVWVRINEYKTDEFMPNLLKDLNDLKEQMDGATERYNTKLAEIEQIKKDLGI